MICSLHTRMPSHAEVRHINPLNAMHPLGLLRDKRNMSDISMSLCAWHCFAAIVCYRSLLPKVHGRELKSKQSKLLTCSYAHAQINIYNACVLERIQLDLHYLFIHNCKLKQYCCIYAYVNSTTNHKEVQLRRVCGRHYWQMKDSRRH